MGCTRDLCGKYVAGLVYRSFILTKLLNSSTCSGVGGDTIFCLDHVTYLARNGITRDCRESRYEVLKGSNPDYDLGVPNILHTRFNERDL